MAEITQEQFQQQIQQQQQLIELMQQQMRTVTNLQAENTRLQTAAEATPAAPIQQASVAAPILNNTAQASFKSKKPDRPVISQGMDDREWAFFKDTWNRYKTMIGIADVATVSLELREACF